MKSIVKLAVALLMAVASTASLAATRGADSTTGTGAFVVGGLGMPSYGLGGNQPIAVRVGGGYNFIKVLDGAMTIGAEAAYADFGTASYSYLYNTTKVHTKGLMVGGVVTWEIPHVQNLAVVGRLGMMNASSTYTSTSVNPFTGAVTGASFSGSSTGMYFGGGIQYAFNHMLAVRAMYEDFGSAATTTPGTSTSLNMISANVVFSF